MQQCSHSGGVSRLAGWLADDQWVASHSSTPACLPVGSGLLSPTSVESFRSFLGPLLPALAHLLASLLLLLPPVSPTPSMEQHELRCEAGRGGRPSPWQTGRQAGGRCGPWLVLAVLMRASE